MHVERVFKVYSGLACMFGFVRAFQQEIKPVNVMALTFAAPVLWPTYVLQDTLDRFIDRRRMRLDWNDS